MALAQAAPAAFTTSPPTSSPCISISPLCLRSFNRPHPTETPYIIRRISNPFQVKSVAARTRRHHVCNSHCIARAILTSCREVLLGITGKDFTLVAASKAAMRGATILKASDDKTRSLNKHTLMAFSGEAGDTGMSAGFEGVQERRD